jgi:hypothetical protein
VGAARRVGRRSKTPTNVRFSKVVGHSPPRLHQRLTTVWESLHTSTMHGGEEAAH